jgi:predicted amidophosphoribosyltransferase
VARDLELHAKHSRELRRWYKEHGICTQCGAGWADYPHVRCPDCMKKDRAYGKKFDPDGSKHRVANRDRREARKAAGLCIDCGAPADGGITQCKSCAEKRRESVRMYRLRQKVKEGRA